MREVAPDPDFERRVAAARLWIPDDDVMPSLDDVLADAALLLSDARQRAAEAGFPLDPELEIGMPPTGTPEV